MKISEQEYKELQDNPISVTNCIICREETPSGFYNIPMVCTDCKKTIINMRKICKRYSCFACSKSNSCDMAYTFFGDCENFNLENS